MCVCVCVYIYNMYTDLDVYENGRTAYFNEYVTSSFFS